MPQSNNNLFNKLYYRAALYIRFSAMLPTLIFLSSTYYLLSTKNRLKVLCLTLFLKQVYDAFGKHPDVGNALISRLYNLARFIPFVKKLLDKELTPVLKDLEKDEFKHRQGEFRFLALPAKPTSNVIEHLLQTVDQHVGDAEQKLSGTLYADPSMREFHSQVYQTTALRNPMHVDVWPGLQDMENQAVAMCLKLYNAPQHAWGQMTGGGTISIFMACLAHRNRARDFMWPVTAPNIVASDRVHPAFKKSAEVLGIKLILVPVNSVTYQVDLEAMEQAITPNTIMLVASAPAFPEGIMDDVAAVANLAAKYSIGCHVDCCLGGFVLPFAQDLQLDLGVFDFRLPGVTSISADNHKYGLAEKGHSTIMFYSYDELGKYSTFTDLTSNMGMYASLGLEGSRPARANAWAAMLVTGCSGYVQNLQGMLAIKDHIVNYVKKLEGIHVSGDPKLPIVAIRSDNPEAVNALLVASKMKENGWHLNGLPNPPGFHLCITPTHLGVKNFAENFTKDLGDALQFAKNSPTAKPRGSLGMYELFRTKIPAGVSGPVLEEIGRQYLGILGSAVPRFP